MSKQDRRDIRDVSLVLTSMPILAIISALLLKWILFS